MSLASLFHVSFLLTTITRQFTASFIKIKFGIWSYQVHAILFGTFGMWNCAILSDGYQMNGSRDENLCKFGYCTGLERKRRRQIQVDLTFDRDE